MKTENEMLHDYARLQGVDLEGLDENFKNENLKHLYNTTGFRLYVLSQSIAYLRGEMLKDIKQRNGILVIILTVWVASMIALIYAICGLS